MATTVATETSSYYLVSTPYHCLLALADAERQAQQPRLFFFGRFDAAKDYLTALQARPPLRPGLVVEGLTAPAHVRSLRRRARGQLLDSLNRWEPRRVIVFNDRHDLSQVALAWASRRGAKKLCFEDGSSFYTDWLAPPSTRLTTWRKRLFTAPGWHPIRVLGTHPQLDSVHVQYPALVRPELLGRVEKLGLDLTKSSALRALAREIISGSDIAQIGSVAPDVLLTPALGARPDWTQAALKRVPPAKRVAFKYHPRETGDDPVGLRGSGLELPRKIATELLYLHWGSAPEMIIGDGRSTTLLTASLFGPGSLAIGLYRDIPPAHTEMFARLGIEMQRYS